MAGSFVDRSYLSLFGFSANSPRHGRCAHAERCDLPPAANFWASRDAGSFAAERPAGCFPEARCCSRSDSSC